MINFASSTASSVTQVWPITLHFIHHPWDNWLAKSRFLWIFITTGNTSIASQNVDNIALLSYAEESFLIFRYIVYIIFLISAQNIDCWYPLEPPRWGGSNEYPQSMFWAETWKKYQFFLSEIFHFFVVKFSVYLNRLVFVMTRSCAHKVSILIVFEPEKYKSKNRKSW